MSTEKLPLMTEENKLAAEIGPIKYIADMLYEKEDPAFIDKAVRLVILIIIIVFDPLAVLLLIAANQSLKQRKVPLFRRKERKKTTKVPAVSVESFVDSNSEIISKDKIAKME